MYYPAMYYPGSQEGIEKLNMEGGGCDDGSGSGGGHVGGRKGDGSAFCIHELVFSRRGVLVEMLAHRKSISFAPFLYCSK